MLSSYADLKIDSSFIGDFNLHFDDFSDNQVRRVDLVLSDFSLTQSRNMSTNLRI